MAERSRTGAPLRRAAGVLAALATLAAGASAAQGAVFDPPCANRPGDALPLVTLVDGAIADGSIAVSGTVDPNGRPATAWFEWAPATGYGAEGSTDRVDGTSSTASFALSGVARGLSPGTAHRISVVATNYCATWPGRRPLSTISSRPLPTST